MSSKMVPDTMAFTDDELLASIESIQTQAQRSFRRYLIVISGEQSWCYRVMQKFFSQYDPQQSLFISTQRMTESTRVEPARVEQCLGHEYDHFAYDAFSGFFPSSFALAEGTVRGGGLGFLLTPELQSWSTTSDAFSHKYAMYPLQAESMGNYFIDRLVRLISEDEQVMVVAQACVPRQAVIKTGVNSQARTLQDDCLTSGQRDAVAQMVHVAKGHRNRPLVVLSNRGHGKSSAIGIACVRLLEQGIRHITITGPCKKATRVIFKQVNSMLGFADSESQYCVEWQGASIGFIAPDALLQHTQKTALLFIDEAAALPVPMLQALLKRYHRIVFSSTVYGYEGNGRGFELKFLQQIDQWVNSWSLLRLQEPVRWGRDDPLENFCYRAFMLAPKLNELPALSTSHEPELTFSEIDRQALVKDESLLQQLFSLLMNAHYRTSPDDLRMMLDAPYIRIFALCADKSIIACALVSKEGGIGHELAQQVLAGERRITGHLLPQTLISEHGLIDTAQLAHARIMRIAVHPQAQGKGFGSLLLKHLHSALETHFDYIGASFGSDARVFRFWDKAGYIAIKLGHKRNAFSGYHSLVVVKALSSNAQGLLEQTAHNYIQRLLFLLSDSLKYVEAGLIYPLLKHFADYIEVAIDEQDRKNLMTFAYGKRSYDAIADALYKLVLNGLGQSCEIAAEDWEILIRRSLQRQSEAEVLSQSRLTGKSQLLAKLRQLCATLLTCEQR